MATSQTSPEVPADFGPIITTRKRPVLDRIVLVGLMLGFGAMALNDVIGAGMMVLQKPGLSLLWMAVCYGCFRRVREVFRTVDFYQGGAVSRCFKRVSQYSYKDAVSLDYGLTRQYVYGFYAETALSLRMQMADNRTLWVGARHKERPKGLAITVFGKKFEGEDEMDVVRDVIASHIANHLATQLSEKGEVEDWAGVRLTPDGIIPRTGPCKNQLVPWGEVRGFTAKAGFMCLFRNGHDKSFVSLPIAAHNFYPGWEVFRALAGNAQNSQAQEAA